MNFPKSPHRQSPHIPFIEDCQRDILWLALRTSVFPASEADFQPFFWTNGGFFLKIADSLCIVEVGRHWYSYFCCRKFKNSTDVGFFQPYLIGLSRLSPVFLVRNRRRTFFLCKAMYNKIVMRLTPLSATRCRNLKPYQEIKKTRRSSSALRFVLL